MLHEPPFKIKSFTDIKQFIEQPLHLLNHTQYAERAVKLTTNSKWRNCWLRKARCTTAGKKSNESEKYFVTKAAHASQ